MQKLAIARLHPIADSLIPSKTRHNERDATLQIRYAMMDAFDPTPPAWTKPASHSYTFACPTCRKTSTEATQVWINRRSPVFTEDYRKKWQEFYQCQCGQVWWAWSNDRPPSELGQRDRPTRDFFNPFEDF